MAYPPEIPPNDRIDATPVTTNHPTDHNEISDALTDIVNELGVNPKGNEVDVETRLDRSTPVGMIVEFGGAIAPPGWVLCDGTAYDGTSGTYGALWAVLGNVWGGTSQTDFEVPDMNGRTTIGPGEAEGIGGPDNQIAEDGGRVDGWTIQHHHVVPQQPTGTFGAQSGTSGNARFGTTGTVDSGGVVGAGSVFNDQTGLNMPPFLVVPKMIKL